MDASVLLVELGAVLLGLGVLGRVADRLGISPIPLYLLTGLALGRGGLYPLATGEDFIHTGSEIGIVLLLLVLGLEYSADELIGNLRRQLRVGVLDLTLNGLPGAVTALALGWGPTAALALAGITAVSSSGIIAKVLADLGRLGNRETPTVLSVLVLEDLAMAVYLPVLTAVLAARGVGSGAAAIAIALATLAAVLVAALRWGRQMSRFLYSENSEVLLLVVLGAALLVAGIAARLQVSEAVGAFLVGIALSGPTAEGAERVLSPLRDLFAAAFFLFFGFSTDPGELGPALPVALALAAVGIATKLGTGWYAAARAGIGPAGRVRAGAALVPRGEFSIVIATLAVGAGVDARLGPIAAAYVLVMAVVGPLLPRALDPLARAAARRAADRRERSATPAADDVPATRPAPRPGPEPAEPAERAG